MIVDTIQNAHKYYSVHPSFKKAFEYIQQTNLDTIEMGKYEIDGDSLKAIFSNKEGMSAEVSTAKFNATINIRHTACINGTEKIGWKPRENETETGLMKKRRSCTVMRLICIFS
jgi:beta-galactosidase beta subunit